MPYRKNTYIMKLNTMQQDKFLLTENFDVFIAYHGTDNPNGSLNKALQIYNLLSKKYKCFFNPVSNSTGSFMNTPIVASHSKLFLLVANNLIKLNENNEVLSPGLYREIEAFYKAHFNDIQNSGIARVYAYGGLKINKANDFHIVFNGSAHFSEDIANAEQQLINWAGCSLKYERFDNVVAETFQLNVDVGKLKASMPPEKKYEGNWVLMGEFEGFQGDFRSRYFSNGRLVLSYKNNGYAALYCYSVSKEYADFACVTAICEGFASVETFLDGQERITMTCDIIARTAIKKMRNSSKHFYMILTPHFGVDNTVVELQSDFQTKNSKGKLIFKRG